jgi:hypothetical protein
MIETRQSSYWGRREGGHPPALAASLPPVVISKEVSRILGA